MTRRPFTIALAIAIGVLNTYLIFGWEPIKPWNVDWIFGDTATYYMGWSLYRQDSHLHFPLAWTERVGYPVGASIAHMDAMPLVAVLLRPFSPLLPDPFQWMGLFSLLCFVLQAYVALRLCHRLFPTRPLFALLGSAFFSFSAPLIWRAFGHTPHQSHFLLLVGLDAYLREIGERPIAWLRPFWIALAVAAGINPYVAVMCLMIALAGVGRLWLEGKTRWARTALLAVATFAVAIGTQIILGVIVEADGKAYMAAGYGIYSLNLNAPVNPMEYGSILIPQLPTIHPLQIEGYNYLGLGIIALLVLGVVRRPQALVWLANRRLIALVVLALACTAVAASTDVSFGSSVLFEVPLPTPLMNVLHTLRASGRLFWPAFYLLFMAALSLTFWTWKDPYRTIILAVALAVQIADLMPLRSKVHAVVGSGIVATSPLGGPEWQGLGAKYDNLILVPPYQCSAFNNAGGYYSYVWFGRLVAAQHMRTNSYYAARVTKRELLAHCVTLMRTQLQGTLDSRSAYLATDGVLTAWKIAGVRSHTCQRLGEFNLCTPVADAETASPLPPPPAPPTYALDTELDFRKGGNGQQYLTVGWADPSTDGTWTEGPIAMLRLGMSAPLDPSRGLLIDMLGQPFVVPELHPRLYVDVVVNGQTIDQWVFRSGAVGPIVGRRSAHIPPAVVAGAREIRIEFRVQNPEAPLYLGVNASSAFAGVNLRRLTVMYE